MKEIDKKKKESETYYMPICMCLGMSIGTAIGVATDNMSMCMCLGVSFGLCIGSVIDARNRAKAKDKAGKPHEETEQEEGIPHCVASDSRGFVYLDALGQYSSRNK